MEEASRQVGTRAHAGTQALHAYMQENAVLARENAVLATRAR